MGACGPTGKKKELLNTMSTIQGKYSHANRLNVVLVGASLVGKSALVHQIVKNAFDPDGYYTETKQP